MIPYPAYIQCEYDDRKCTGCGRCSERREIHVCNECGDTIYEGDEYRLLADMPFCESCALKSIRTASVDELQ